VRGCPESRLSRLVGQRSIILIGWPHFQVCGNLASRWKLGPLFKSPTGDRAALARRVNWEPFHCPPSVGLPDFTASRVPVAVVNPFVAYRIPPFEIEV